MKPKKPAYKIDPEFSHLLGDLTEEQYAQLRANIKRDGQREPVVVWKETKLVLEGHNRLKICEELGIKPKVVFRSFPDTDTAIDWIFKQQSGRRNLGRDERDRLLAEHVRILKERKERTGSIEAGVVGPRGPTTPQTPGSGDISAKVAEARGVSPRTVKRAVTKASDTCDRCLRVGKTTNCPQCEELKAAAKPKKKKPRGPSLFADNSAKIKKLIGEIHALVNEVPDRKKVAEWRRKIAVAVEQLAFLYEGEQ